MPSHSTTDDRDRPGAGEGWPAKLVGGRLREARRGRGLTLDDVAGAAGLTKSFVSAVERGDTSPSIGSLYRLCEVLGISISEIFETVESDGLAHMTAGSRS